MGNRYQLFLKNTLRAGVKELYADPSLAEVIGIPRPTFEVLVRAFRSGLSQELLENLPLHDLSNEEYLGALLNRIDFLLSPGRIGEVEEITLSNMPNLVNLLPAYNEAKSLQVAVSSYQKTWQVKLSQQIEKYNRDLIFGLQKQLEKDLPSLPPEKREILVRDLARTIQDQAFPAIELSWQTKDKLREATELTLKNYASEVEGLRKPELVSQIAKRVAEEQETATWETRGAQISATTLPPTYEIDSSLRAAIIANLPAEVYQRNPKIAEQISQQVLGRLSLPSLAAQPTLEDYQKELAKEIRVVIATPAIQKTIGSLSDFPSAIAYQVAPTAQAYSTSPQATAVGGTAVGGAPPPVAPPILGGPLRPLTAPKGGLEDIFFSQGSPGHILTSLASPRAGESFGRWAITGGLLRGPLGFALESIPGTPKLNYLLDLYGPYLEGIKGSFIKELAEAQKLPLGYEREQREQGARTHLAIISQFEIEKQKKPWLNLAYQGKVGLYRILHPVRYFQMKMMGRSLALGVSVSSLTDILSAYVKYGGYGGAYVTEAVLKNLAVFALKVVGVKIGLYEVVGVYPYQKYVFKPTHRLKLKAQEFIYKRIGGLVKKLGGSALGKLVSFVVTSFLTGGGRVIFELLRRFWKWIAGGLGLLLLWLITKLGTIGGALTFLAGSVIGGAIGWFLGGPVGAVIGAIVGPIIAGGIVVLLKNLLSPGAVVVGGGLGGGAGLAPSLVAYAKIAPVAIVGVAGATMLVNTITSSAFLVPAGEPSPVQSEYIEVAKSVSFSGNLGESINYTLTITASRSRLVNVEIADTTSFTCAGTAPTVPVRNFIGQIPGEIIPGTPLILSYQVLTDQQFNDCLVDNTVRVTADVPDEQKTNEQSFTTGSVTIGNPPVVAPRGLPLKGNVCLSGYDFNELKRDGNLHQGIDIISDQLTAYSTFPQESRVVDVCGGAYCLGMPGGYSITLGLGPYSIYLAHLAEPPNFNLGDEVGPGAPVGIMGDTGTSSFGAHVHYMIQENGRPVNPHNYGANPPKCP